MTNIDVASFDTQIAAQLPLAEESESKACTEASLGQKEMLKNNIAQAYSHFGNAGDHLNTSKTIKANIAGLSAQKAVAEKEAAAAAERDEEKALKAKTDSSLKILDPESKTPVDADMKAKVAGTVAAVNPTTTETKSVSSAKKAD